MICYKYRGKNTGPQCVKMDLEELGCGDMDWIELAEDKQRWLTLLTAVMNLPGS
jgi:hypothetical protein